MKHRRHIIPAVALSAYGTIFEVHFWILGFDDPIPRSPASTARLAWAASVVPFVFSSFTVIAVSLYSLHRHSTRWARAHCVAASSAVPITVIMALIVGRAFPGEAAGFGRVYSVSDVTASSITTANGVFVWAGTALAASVCCILLKGVGEVSIDGLAMRLRTFQIELLVCAGMLAAAVLQTALLYRWGAAAYTGPEQVGDYAGAITLASGLLFSGVLLIGFMPVAIALGVKFDELAASAASRVDGFELERWKIAHNLPGSPTQLFQTYVAMLAPLLVALTSGFLGSAAQGRW